jgi:hypothetical protein
MRTSPSILFGLVLLLPAVCHAQAKCPWINEATARGMLGGAVTVTANVGDHGEGVCEFSRQQGAAVHQLRIAVDIMADIPKQFPAYLAQCPPKSSPLRAIGNEAVTCSVQEKEKKYGERVVGRVRDQAFVVSVTSSARDDASLSQETCRAKVNLAAEQVAGILF